jgi:hypothetical protein
MHNHVLLSGVVDNFREDRTQLMWKLGLCLYSEVCEKCLKIKNPTIFRKKRIVSFEFAERKGRSLI